MIVSGVQYPPGHGASSARSGAGTRSAGRQCVPSQAGLQDGKVDGSSTAGPAHGHVKTSGGFWAASQPSEQAPVGSIGVADVGSKQGAQIVPLGHVDCGRSLALAAMSGRQVDTQRPSAPASDVHVGGTKLLPVAMTGSGRQYPFGQVESLARWSAGTISADTQCAPPQAGLHGGNAVGSTTFGPVQGQVKVSGGNFGWSQASAHAPVGANGFNAVGS
jgi:hypothetical protein